MSSAIQFNIENSNEQSITFFDEFDKFVEFDISTNTFSPSKINIFIDKKIKELIEYHKINPDIIKLIYNNLDVFILNTQNCMKDYINNPCNNLFSNEYLHFIHFINVNKIDFDYSTKITIDYLLSLDKCKITFEPNLSECVYKYSSFIIFIYIYIKYKLLELLNIINYNIGKIIYINNIINNTLKYIEYLKMNETIEFINDFLNFKIDTYNKMKKLIVHYNEIKKLKFDNNNIIYMLFEYKELEQMLGDQNIYLIFFYGMLKYDEKNIDSIERKLLKLESINQLTNKDEIISNFITLINDLELEVFFTFDIYHYVHNQQIINDHAYYLKALYSLVLDKIGIEETNNTFTDLINKKDYQLLVRFFLTIIQTRNEDLIYL